MDNVTSNATGAKGITTISKPKAKVSKVDKAKAAKAARIKLTLADKTITTSFKASLLLTSKVGAMYQARCNVADGNYITLQDGYKAIKEAYDGKSDKLSLKDLGTVRGLIGTLYNLAGGDIDMKNPTITAFGVRIDIRILHGAKKVDKNGKASPLQFGLLELAEKLHTLAKIHTMPQDVWSRMTKAQKDRFEVHGKSDVKSLKVSYLPKDELMVCWNKANALVDGEVSMIGANAAYDEYIEVIKTTVDQIIKPIQEDIKDMKALESVKAIKAEFDEYKEALEDSDDLEGENFETLEA